VFFFRPEMANRPVYLCIDRSVLARVAADNGFPADDPVASLTAAVRRHVPGEPPLRWWVDAAFQWRRSGRSGTPPFVAALAVTVLAATASDDGANIRSYYRTLRALLGLPPGVDAPKEFDSDIQQLWTWLREWLDDHEAGALGRATATKAAGWANVGWAISQTVLSPLDRAKLPLFFTAIGAQAGQRADGELLATQLTSWAAGNVQLSSRLTRALADRTLRALLAQTLAGELALWDGQLSSNADQPGVQLLLSW
jgi:hypothetical protein